MFARFDNRYAHLPPSFFSRCHPTPVAAPGLLALNRALAAELDIGSGWTDAQWAQLGAGNVVPEGAEPISLAYAGHQFGQFVPLLGDGRAILIGEVNDIHGRPRDLQWKGAGLTPYSRRGDGRAALGPVLREYLVSEFMAARGVPATRALTAASTGETVRRDRPMPGAVLIRVASSHVRVGTFQFLAARGDVDGLAVLRDHVIDRLAFPVPEGRNRALSLLERVIERQARLVADWMALGFVHGVMNTDNMAISGETIDFGPCAFLESYDPDAVFSSIDDHGRYAYSRQPAIARWNLTRLAECLLPLIDADTSRAVELASTALADFGRAFEHAWHERMARKFGLTQLWPDDTPLIDDWFGLLREHRADFTLSFRALCDDAANRPAWADWRLPADALDPWLERWNARLTAQGGERAQVLARMRVANPGIIPRNHHVEAVLEAAIAGDPAPWRALLEAATAPQDDPVEGEWAIPATDRERVIHTFCGT